ncbi:PREDICTED: uncharacterized protein LOC104738242 [Camelina sativa]|uniref:Uncharacterized protein LOC104738242 n=1 Tax=Camelina sativa TaxID=90675 RepID=A0ABM0VIK7_CAMSA|nr:PREDICTED: uncharacterized protein LOC104738242 [Camelina sativa]
MDFFGNVVRDICSVQVLINGQPHGSIFPSIGLRQEDPLSSYLFILCTEVLIANLRKAERSKLITSIKVSTACPAVSHLLFADDSLFFCRATKEQCEVVLGVLKQYERVSGQRINFQKSSVQFGHTVDASLREELKGVLDITTLGGMSSYLGIPESLGGSKTKIFSFFQDRLQSRAGRWPARLLSRGGKEVMIKSVTRKLTSAISNFWWSSSGDSRALHWIAWDRLCDNKLEGDRLGWHLTKSGVYTVKSGYNTLRQKPETSLTVSRPNIVPLQAFVWQLRCAPKIWHFLWQALSGCVATTANLRRRGMGNDMECARCGVTEETINHALFLCPLAWQETLRMNLDALPGDFENLTIAELMSHYRATDGDSSGPQAHSLQGTSIGRSRPSIVPSLRQPCRSAFTRPSGGRAPLGPAYF